MQNMQHEKGSFLVVIDPGHGGWDNGASWEGRLEKDDNLHLGLLVREALEDLGISNIMTRDTDVYIMLSERAEIANEAGADLFISLHRNSYPEQLPTAMGVENYIYLTAPEEPTGRAAQLVLDSVVDVGVQADRGVSRGDYYVLRRTKMPAMLLEMGFINNDIDNQLFDEHLAEYAQAIARAVKEYQSTLEDSGNATPCECPICPNATVMHAQLLLNSYFGLNIPPTGVLDATSVHGAIMALQMALNHDLGADLSVDGILGERTLAAFNGIFPESRGYIVLAVQLALMLNGYDIGVPDGVFGRDTQHAAQKFARDNNLKYETFATPQMLSLLFK